MKNKATNKTTKTAIAKQNGKMKQITTTSSNDEVRKLFIIIGIVVGIILIFYGISYLVTREKKKDPGSTESTIQYSEIIVGSLLNQPDTEYYVLATKNDDAFISLYASYFSVYGKKDAALPYYTLNLDGVFNKKYVGETSNFTIQNISEIRFSDATLLKIKDKQISAIYEGKDRIVEALAEMIK